MARASRLILPGVPVHLIQRGNNRTATFRSDRDYERYRELLHEASQRCEIRIHAYVLMSNHLHLLVTPGDASGPSRLFQAIGGPYVRFVNARYHRTGTLWEGRFRSCVITSERYLLICSRYIELNPVRAQMVDTPDKYRWSSHRHNAFGAEDPLVTPHELYERLGMTSSERQSSYRALFQDPIDPPALEHIRLAAHRGVALSEVACRRDGYASSAAAEVTLATNEPV